MASKSATLLAITLSVLLFSSILTSATRPAYAAAQKCPKDALKLNVCVDVLKGLVGVKLPAQQKKCCGLIEDVLHLHGAACLCTKLQVDVLNLIKLPIKLDLSLLLNDKCKLAKGFKC